ncbi:unnamed protein product [marine sediment metagenome]|uniref:HTH cro/C1-type domain-containing protein n=1 Tax=marine sediment metagenome TaxID=412755 RepID=X0T4W8_9ZZZZ
MPRNRQEVPLNPKEIIKLRKKLGLTQRAFADLFGCTTNTANLWENGHAEPNDYFTLKMRELAKKVKK